jgi:hypothetical protein
MEEMLIYGTDIYVDQFGHTQNAMISSHLRSAQKERNTSLIRNVQF